MAIIKKPSKNYQAISCSLHSEYELAILQQRLVDICWKDKNGESHQKRLMPYDLSATKGEEYLLAKAEDGSEYKIRLDYIVCINQN